MHDQPTIFPADDFGLLLVILVMPLLGAIVNGLFGRRLGKPAVTLMALSAVGVSFIACVATYGMLLSQHSGEEPARFLWHGWKWLEISGNKDLQLVPIEVAFSVDALSGTMSLVVTGVGFLIHLYSTQYMKDDPGYARFFCYLNLFIFSMLVLILGDNLPVLFVGWEGVGLCSYLLIGFWFSDEKNAAAGKKAFITNRVGDFGLLVAMGLLVVYGGGLDWKSMQTGASGLLTPVQLWPIVAEAPGAAKLQDWGLVSLAEWWNAPRYASAATLIGLFLFLGCAGKSAQLPLYVWLPDAMAGPTPVSALIHAATMVTAGVYLVCRMSPVFVMSPMAMFTVALVGALTAVFAATIAFAQRDIKKVLAYSTVSQLGFMFLGAGTGAFAAGFFHVITHAFFKACLFLGAGSVIHAMHARIHDSDAAQDMQNMGGLRRYLPITFWTFVASWAAIVGLPGTSGFFSKDEILFKAYTSSVALPKDKLMAMSGGNPVEFLQWPEWGGTLLVSLGVAGAVMTAFYMSRLVVGIFLGEFRGWKVVQTVAAGHGQHAEHSEHAEDGPREGPPPHESPWEMTVPLIILAALALVGGFFNAPLLHIAPLEHVLHPVFANLPNVTNRPDAEELVSILLLPGILAFVVGVAMAWWVYVRQRGEPARIFVQRFPGFHALVFEKWRVDELYKETVIGALEVLADVAVWVDKWIVDGILARLTSFLVQAAGALLRLLQNGRAPTYATLMVLGLAGVGWFTLSPHASAAVDGDAASGQYVLSAAPGFGYGYRWDKDGDGHFESKAFGDEQRLQVELKRRESRAITLQVRNAFGRRATTRLVLERPPEDAQGPAGMPGQKIQRIEVDDDGKGRPLGRPRPLRLGRPDVQPGQEQP